MSVLAQIFTDTVRTGGSLIFIKDKAPRDLQERLLVLSGECESLIPFCLRSLNDFKKGHFSSSSRDLFVLFEDQKFFISELGVQGQGQRLLFTEAEIGEPLDSYVDFGSTEVTLKEWSRALKESCESLKHLAPREFFDLSFQRPCLFLDRDDVVVKNVAYNTDPDKVELMPGIIELIHQAHQKNYWVALVTNQSGLGRKWVNWQQYQDVHQRMLQLLAAQGAWIDEAVWSAYISEAPTEEGRLYASLRKPRGGMFQRVSEKLRPDLGKSVMVGDSATDLIAAHTVGIKKLYLLHSEKVQKEQKALENFQALEGRFSFELLSSLDKAAL